VKGILIRSLQANYRFWVLAAFLLEAFILGGGARDDIVSLIVLRPLTVVFLGFGLWNLEREHVRQFRGLFVLVGACFALTLIHLVPLPPSIWTSLPGREDLAKAGEMAGLANEWRPISVAPVRTWNALFSLLVPLTALVLLAQASFDQRAKLLPFLLAVGLFNALLSVAQVIGSPDGPLYFYRITNNGAPVGLFSNRNHNAAFLLLLFPMLALYGRQWLAKPRDERGERARFSTRDLRPLLLIATGLALVTLILVAGSRGGLIIGGIALLLMPLLLSGRVRQGTAPRGTGYLALITGWRGLVAAILVLAVGTLTVFFSRAVAIQRLLESGGEGETRFRVWGPIAEISRQYFPVGSGLGTFVEAYQKDEPLAGLARTYVNHAHNDTLELLLTAGLPGLLLVLAAIVYWMLRSWPLFISNAPLTPQRLLGRLGAITVFLLALASVADYPLRVPSLACVFVVGLAWLIDGNRQGAGGAA
jgi:O-antigen ligase